MNYKKLKFKNFTVLLNNCSGTESVVLDLFVKIGSRDENIETSGYCHFLEHIYVHKIREKLKSHSWLQSYIEDNSDAYTDKNKTNYSFSFHKKDLDKVFSLLGIILSSEIDELKLEEEKRIVVDEISRDENDGQVIFDKLFDEYYFGENSLAFDVLGNKNSVQGINFDKIKSFINEYYKRAEVVLVISGDFNFSDLEKKIEKSIKELSFYENDKEILSRLPFDCLVDEIKDVENKIDRSYFAYGQSFSSLNNKDYNEFLFFINLLNNYLYYNLSRDLGIYAFNLSIENFGDFIDLRMKSDFAKEKKDKFFKYLKTIIVEFKENLKREDLEYFKKQEIKTLSLIKNKNEEQAYNLAWQAMTFPNEEIIDFNEQIKIIENIDLENIYKYFDIVFKDKNGRILFWG